MEKQIVRTWEDLGRNKWGENYHPHMLTEEGYIAIGYYFFKGDGRYHQPELSEVLFDRDYVVARTVKHLKPLFVDGFDEKEFDRLILEVKEVIQLE